MRPMAFDVSTPLLDTRRALLLSIARGFEQIYADVLVADLPVDWCRLADAIVHRLAQSR